MADKSSFRQMLDASSVGINLVVSTFIGLAVGYGLDKLFRKTYPWLTIIFLVLGIISGFRELVRFARKQDNGTGKKDI